MRKQTFIAGAFAILALASCSNDEVVSNVQSAQLAQQSIGFSPMTKGATRGVVGDVTELGNFAVTAYLATALPDGDNIYISSSSPATITARTIGSVYNGMENIQINVDNTGAADYDNVAQTNYWPYTFDATTNNYVTTTKLDFVGISPASIGSTTDADGKFTASTTGGKIQKYKAGTDDVLFAFADDKQQSDGAVPMHFRHLLSLVQFQAKRAAGFEVSIGKIDLVNIPNEASATITANGDSSTEPTITWTMETTAEKQNISVTGATITAEGDDADPQALGNPSFVIPQDASTITYDAAKIDGKTKYDTTNQSAEDNTNGKTIAVEQRDDNNHWNSTDNQAYSGTPLFLRVSVRIKNPSGDYSLGSATTYDDIYFAVKSDWKPGKKYIYTMLFGGVKGPNGQAGSTSTDIAGGTYNDGKKPFTSSPITFTCDVEAWVDYDANVAF